jgi:heme oxygenase
VSVVDRLRRKTRLAHEQIERAVNLEERLSSRERYTDLVGRFYGFHGVWEPQAAAIIADPCFFEGRRKLVLLGRDLKALGMDDEQIASLPLCTDPGPMPTRAEALGSMYVVEGSTLGGTLISRQVETCLGLTATTGCAYFRSYGSEVGRMWQSFRAYLNGALMPHEHGAAVASANGTFACLQAWLCEGVVA